MPGPGDHNRPQAIAANPFEEAVPRISEYTAKEIAILQSRLDKQLGPEYISTRPGNGGGKVHYLAAEKVINLANEVFGFNGWSSQIKEVQIDFVDEVPNTGKVSLGMSIIMRVSLRDGTFHEDIGYGHIENCKGKAAAFEKAKKEAATDALKRALRNFGNVLGNCLYDKDYLQKVTKIKAPPSKWDALNLHRHHDFAIPAAEMKAPAPAPAPPMRQEEKAPALPTGQEATSNFSIEFEDDFGGGNLFDGVELGGGRTEDITMGPPETPTIPMSREESRPQQLQRTASLGKSMPPPPIMNAAAPQGKPQMSNRPQMQQAQSHSDHNSTKPQHPSRQKPQHSTPPEQQTPTHPGPIQQPTPQSLQHPQQQSLPPQANGPPAPPAGHEPPVGFYTGRAAMMIASGPPADNLAANLRFNPNAESPSIRKTSGFNHATSKPLTRAEITGGNAPPAAAPTDNAQSPAAAANRAGSLGPGVAPARPAPNGPAAPTNFVNPADNAGRRIGAPNGGSMSPHPMRTSAYKPPSMAAGAKRSYATSVAAAQVDGAVGREPLRDVSNMPVGNGGATEGDALGAKRLRSDG